MTSLVKMCSVHSIPHTLRIVLFLMLPPPPSSTLFPYTTLFRSLVGYYLLRGYLIHGLDLLNQSEFQQIKARLGPDYRDRKSTRLNSSHEWISYAVFCLKKKVKISTVDTIASLRRTAERRRARTA